MIPLSKIWKSSDKPPQIQPYQDKDIIFWGEEGEDLVKLLEKFHYSPKGYCSFLEERWGTVHDNSLVLSPEIFFSLYPQGENVVIQLAMPEEEEKQIKDFFAEKAYPFVLGSQEAREILSFFAMENPEWLPQLPQVLAKNQLIETLKGEEYALSAKDTPLFLCMPPKTGDHSLMDTFRRENIPHHFLFHQPSAVPHHCGPIKLITAVRDPVAQNISFLYQVLADLSHSMTAHFLFSGKDFFQKENGVDVEEIFHHFCHKIMEGRTLGTPPIQRFITDFFQDVVDLTAHPFDPEKGFTVIEENDLSIFVFQLEKLDELLPELSQFIGHEITHLEHGNLTATKWVGQSYEQAVAELSFPEGYLDFSYSAPWVKYFYGENMMEQMKEKWERR
ncbi:MAG: putative capsular polysaccharide synthesis family protein [Eubacteriales bacterium]